MPGQTIALIFPAFVNEYPEEAFRYSNHFTSLFYSRLAEASRIINPCLEKFDPTNNSFLEDEFKTQFITYVYACTVSELIRRKEIHAAFTTGLSMGIYAALYHSGSITFETGLRLISKAYLESIQCLKSRQYGMGSVIGLSVDDLQELIAKNNLLAEITNISSPYSLTFSGLFEHVVLLLEKAREEGALHTRILKASVPYHTEILRPTEPVFRQITDELPVSVPGIPIVSQIDQQLLETPAQIRSELVRNLFTHLNWQKTQEFLAGQGVDTFIECGPGRNLLKNARFFKGAYKFQHFSDFIE